MTRNGTGGRIGEYERLRNLDWEPKSVRFEDTDRWARGRVVAALAAGERLPEGLESWRLQRVLDGLARDGLVVLDASGLRLP